MHRKGHLNLFLWHTCLVLLESWMVVIWFQIGGLFYDRTQLRQLFFGSFFDLVKYATTKRRQQQRFAINFTRSCWFVCTLFHRIRSVKEFFVKGIYCYISFLTFSYIMNRYRDAIRKSLSPQNLFKCVLLYIESTMHIKSVDLHKLLTRLFSINLPISPYVFTLKNRIQTHLNVYTLAHFIK